MTRSRSSKGGFTLVEVLAAVVIMMIGLLGLLQAINVAVANDVRNKLRDEAVAIGEDQVNRFRLLSSSSPPGRYQGHVKRAIRGVEKDFVVVKELSPASADLGATTRLNVTVRWAYKNFTASHTVSTVVRR